MRNIINASNRRDQSVLCNSYIPMESYPRVFFVNFNFFIRTWFVTATHVDAQCTHTHTDRHTNMSAVYYHSMQYIAIDCIKDAVDNSQQLLLVRETLSSLALVSFRRELGLSGRVSFKLLANEEEEAIEIKKNNAIDRVTQSFVFCYIFCLFVSLSIYVTVRGGIDNGVPIRVSYILLLRLIKTLNCQYCNSNSELMFCKCVYKLCFFN